MWIDIAQMFELALQEMGLRGDEVILDLGAGQGWASRLFAERGCKVFAQDLVADRCYGLGRSWAIMEQAGIYFEPVVADGEQIPFFPERFDIVFLCGALHHFERLDSVLSQIYCVLKPGGRVIATAEPAISLFSRERKVQARLEETRHGIIERRPKVFQYWWAFRRAGFNSIAIDTSDTYNALDSHIRDWILTLSQEFVGRFGSRYGVPVRLFFRFMLMLPPRWAAWAILQLRGGSLLVRAVKPLRIDKEVSSGH
jgi:ubiquinone/menaquinone biosynthesis C-methylase UbiE